MSAAHQPATDGARPRGGWFVAPILLGLLAIAGMGLAVRHVELLAGNYIAGGVPPLAAFATLVVLLLWRNTLGRLSARFNLTRRQILLSYLVVCAGVPILGSYLVRAWLPHLVALRYWERTLPELAGLSQYLPRWIGPLGEKAITAYYEGSHQAGAVPWAQWRVPLIMWSSFLLAIGVAMYSLMALVQAQWIRHERLTFPLLYLPLTLTAPDDGGPASRMFRRHWFWIAVGLTLIFNGLNVAHAVIPSIPAPGFSKSLAPYFMQRPWTPFRSFNLYYMLETIGFGYFIPLEVTFTVWFSYLSLKLFACTGIALGYEEPGFPFIHEQSAGAYLAVALFVAYGLRRHLRTLWQLAWRGDPKGEPVAWLGVFCGLGYLLWFMGFTGLPLIVAAVFLIVLLAFVLVYARIRAETGAPLEFTYPYWMPKNLVTWGFTTSGLMSFGGPRVPVVFGLFSWLSRHHWDKELAAYDIDAFKLSDHVGISRSVLATAVALAVVVALGVSIWAHLDAYYDVGTNLASGSMGRGEYRATVALEEFKRTAAEMQTLPGRPWVRLDYVGGGFVLAAVMAVLRSRFPGWPLHPLGFILATAYGDHNTCIFPLFLAWLARSAVLKIGGLKGYRAGIPFFVGLIAGHFFFAGVCWPILSVALGPEVSRSYHLFFGG